MCRSVQLFKGACSSVCAGVGSCFKVPVVLCVQELAAV